MRTRAGLVLAGALAALSGAACPGPGPPPDAWFVEGEALRLKYEKDASREAIARFEAAQAAWKRAGDAARAARAGQRIGMTQEQLGSLRASLESYREALPLAQASGDRLLESEIRSDLGVAQALVADREEQLEEARTQCEAALALARQLGEARGEAKALNCLGETAYSRLRPEEALAFYRRAGELWDRLGDPRGQAQTLLYEGHAHSDLSRFDEARTCYQRAQALWRSLRDRRQEAITVVGQARVLRRRGEYQQALNAFESALALLRPMGDAVWEGSSLSGIAAMYLELGDTRSALQSWERALELFEAAGVEAGAVDALLFLGATYLGAGDDVRALGKFERALVLAEEQGIVRWKAVALRFIGLVHLVRGQPREAREFLERSLALQRRSPEGGRDLRDEARTLADLGEALLLLREHGEAARVFEPALALARSGGDRVAQARALLGLARASRAIDELEAARRYVERSLEIVELLRSEVENRDLRVSYLASVYRQHELHMQVLMQLHALHPGRGLAAAAFAASERARARSLIDALAESGVDLAQGVDPALLRRERQARRAFDDWAERQRRGTPPSAGDGRAFADEYRELEDRYQQIQAEIRSRSPRYAALVRPRPLGLGEVQARVLDADTLLLEYALGDERSFLWAVSQGDYASYELPPREEIERRAQRVYALLTARLDVVGDPRERRRRVERADADYWAEAARLGEVLLGPVAARMTGKRVLVVADGALQSLPFAALPVPRRSGPPVPVVVEHEIVSLPSASVLAVLRTETQARKPPGKSVAVLADPVFEPDDPRLRAARGDGRPRAAGSAARGAGAAGDTGRHAGYPRLAATLQEADAIVRLAPAGTTLRAVGFAASRATATSRDLAGYRVVHFATHGVLDDENPGLSGIVLSRFDERGQAQDGMLRLTDVYGLRLGAELVVLSACRTALGKPVRGEGLVGLVRGFMYAGAKRVVASLWKVDDDATGELMRSFYRGMLEEGRSPAAALRAAQVAMWRQDRWSPPYYWAAFLLQGEWR